MSYEKLAALEAWSRITKSSGSQWEEASKRLGSGPVPVYFRPAFGIDRTSKVFCMGSCFARNIEEHLIYRGIPVLSKRLRTTDHERTLRPNGSVNKFTSHSMLQELRWLRNPPSDPATFFVPFGDAWLDLQLAPGVGPTTLERAIERRAYLSGEYFARIVNADVVILTLGLNEVWRDLANNVWWNGPPRLPSVKRQPERYELHVTDVAENVAALDEFHQILSEINPRARVVVTVSPVPMSATFSGDDILIANTRSKCTLRAAAEEFSRNHKNVAYFPSFEMITLADSGTAYAPDRLHVLDEAVSQVTGAFIAGYVGDIPPLDPSYVEMLYLAANPDVDARVRSGELVSGLEHWLAEGRARGRPIRPTDVDARMVAFGLYRPKD